MKIYKKIQKNRLLFDYLSIINSMYSLTYRQLEILELIFKYRVNGITEISNSNLRKNIMKDTTINKNNLSAYLAIFEKKGIISKDKSGFIYINKELIPIVDNNEIYVEIVISVE